MADEHRFSADMPAPTGPVEGKSRWQSCLMGCLVVFVILVVVAILIGFWISRNWRDWAATAATEGIRQGISSSHLPAQEQQEIMVEVDRVARGFREKTISGEQLGKLVEKLVQSPLMSLMVASTIDQQFFAKSGLSEEEKVQGRQIVQRFFRARSTKRLARQASTRQWPTSPIAMRKVAGSSATRSPTTSCGRSSPRQKNRPMRPGFLTSPPTLIRRARSRRSSTRRWQRRLS